MQMTIDCPRCGSPLLVPETAAGRRARCTACEAKFVIPSAEEMLDMTVSHMVLDELTLRGHHEEDDAEEPSLAEYGSDGEGGGGGEASGEGTVVGVQVAADVNDQSAVMSVDEVHGGDAEDAWSPGDAWSGGQPSATPRGVKPALTYPQALLPREARPYLVVREVTVDGVLIAFASRWLREEVFRCSMPMRCCASGLGVSPNQKLSARPMIFVNRTETGEDRARTLELRYETAELKSQTPRELVREIGRMKEMTPPFDLPMLYYAQAGRPVDAMECVVRQGTGEEESCEVRVPSGAVAVQWLERVNGRCGAEYAQLRQDVAQLTSDAWSQLPIKTRQRLEPWTKFQRGEKFLLYLNDPDFTVADAGLAGVVLTDKRLIYHKYRRLRSVTLNQDATLHVRPDPTSRVVRLTLESAGRMARAGKIQRGDMPKLIECLSDARLRVMVGGG